MSQTASRGIISENNLIITNKRWNTDLPYSQWAYNWILDICHFLNFKTAPVYKSPWAYKHFVLNLDFTVVRRISFSMEARCSFHRRIFFRSTEQAFTVAVKVLKNEAVVGHVPREISPYCSFILNSGGTMSATVTGAEEIGEESDSTV